MLELRPVRLDDRPAVETLCATIWDGEDYIPAVFDDWLLAPNGWFMAVVQDETLVGLARLARLAPGEYWLQGLRIHPAHRGRGLGARLFADMTGLWRRLGEPGALRLMTESDNHAVIHLCERAGFVRKLELIGFGAAAETGPHHFQPLPPDEAARAFEVCARMPRHAAQAGLADTHWKWQALTPDLLYGRALAGRLFGWNDLAGVLLLEQTGAAAGPAPHKTRLRIEFGGFDPAQQPAFLREVRALAGALGRAQVRWYVPREPALEADLQAAGYARLWDGIDLCFEARQ